ncbi:universal stress protein [Halobaculum limi]|uniref:universal stress protein n=1 Tax=Halobaculum limi TaxID=3031916 RepID=UPI002404BC9C|nr:universal stress protein [Halobaculum sp. YSMS11]
MYDDVLLPFDGSDGAMRVLHHAAEIAHRFDATVHLLYVADTGRDSVTVVDGQAVDALVQAGEDVLEDAEETLRSLGCNYDRDILQGNPAQTIAEYAERYEYDLIVMPTRGREGIVKYFLGSVTEKVVKLSSVPVLTARMQPDEQLVFPYEEILIPTDGSESASRAADHALSLAAALDASVHVLSVVDEGALGFDVRSVQSSEAGETAAEEAVDGVAQLAEDHGIDEVVRHVEHGSPVERILDCIDETGTDAVVMGTTGRRGTDRILLGSVAEKTIQSAPVPVITVGDGDS